MKKVFFSAAMLVSTGLVFSAYLPTINEPTYPLPLRSPIWTGFYLGFNAGGTWLQNTKMNVLSSFVAGSQNPTFPEGAAYTGLQSAIGASGAIPVNSASFIGGAQFGYNLQVTDQLVGGIEADLQKIAFGHNKGQTSNIVPLIGTFDGGGSVYVSGEQFVSSLNGSQRVDYLGTLRGRLGLLVTPMLLIHGIGGFAYGHVSSSVSITQINNDNTFFPPSQALNPLSSNFGNYSNTRFGFTFGGDLECMFMSNLSARIEYLYYDLGSASYTLSPLTTINRAVTGSFATVSSQVKVHFNGNIIRANISYHFD